VRRFLPKISVLLFAGLWRRGIGWYLLRRKDGRGNKASIATSSAISCSWFSSWVALAGIPLVATASIFVALGAVAVAITGFSIARILDKIEVQRRLNPN
jgi:divalent metal cation (Fe/Co/Zn/Cd) transporter